MTGVCGPGGGYQQGLYLQLLGPIAATRADSALALGHARQRTVLAVLALPAGPGTCGPCPRLSTKPASGTGRCPCW
jgi:hypothetical protein